LEQKSAKAAKKDGDRRQETNRRELNKQRSEVIDAEITKLKMQITNET